MNDPFSFFDRIYCINLDRRTERWSHVCAELERVGLRARVERVPAVEARDGAEGCRDSHVECVRRALHAGAHTMLVLEDDMVFVDDPRPGLRAAIAELDATGEWEAFYLGGQLVSRPSRKLAYVVRARMKQTHAIALQRGAFKRALHSTVPVDDWYATHLVSYGASPPLAYQVTDASDISRGVQDRRQALERSHRLYVRAPYSLYLAGRAFYATRHGVGRALVATAALAGVPLRFEGMRPRIDPPRDGPVHHALRAAYAVGDELRLRARAVPAERPRRALLAYWGSIEGGTPTIGDELAVVALARLLRRAAIEAEIASVHQLPSDVRAVPPASVDAARYGVMVFVCGPLTVERALLRFTHRFAHAKRLAAGVSVVPGHERALRLYDTVLARDGAHDARDAHTARFDLALSGEAIDVQPSRNATGPVRLCLRGAQVEYGAARCHADCAEDMLATVAARLGGASARVDTVLSANPGAARDIEQAFAHASIVLTTRLHGALLSLRAGVPFVAVDQIASGAKVSEVLGALGYPYVFNVDRVSVAELEQAAHAALASSFRPRLLELRARAIEKARAALDEAGRAVEAAL